MALPVDRFCHSKKHSDSTKNGHTTTKPHVGLRRECKLAQRMADAAATTSGLEINFFKVQRAGHIRTVSSQGLRKRTPKTTNKTGPSMPGGVLSGAVIVTTADNTRLGMRLISAARQT